MISLISHGLRESSLSILASNSYIYKQKPKTTKKITTRERTKSLPYHYWTPFSPHIPFLQLKPLPLGQKLKKKKNSYRKDVFHFIFLLTLNTSITSIISLKFKNPQWEQTWQAGIRHSLFVSFLLQTHCHAQRWSALLLALILSFVPLLPFPMLSMSPFL